MIRCVICAVELKKYEFGGIPNSEYVPCPNDNDPANLNYENGVVGRIQGGYPCRHDTHNFIIGICDNCIDQYLDEGRIIDEGSFLDSPEFKKYREKVTRTRF